MERKKRTIIIGLDGVSFDLLEDLANKKIMPNVKEVISRGGFKKMQSSIPEISSVAWSSIVTGMNPAEHGIFGFTDLAPNTYCLSYPNLSNLKASPFWERDNTKQYVIANVPSTYPARQLNGALVSGFVALDFDRAVYPTSMINDLKNMDYRIDVDSGRAHKSMELFVDGLKKTNEARIAAYKHLWNREWDTFMFVFTGTDRLMHFLWDAYEDKSHDFHKAFNDYFKRIDDVIGETLSMMKDEDSLVMLSDHGFEGLENDVYVNFLLKEKGFLKFQEEDRKSLSNIDCDAKVFALDPSRIYINLKGKYPRGNVSLQDKKYIIRDIEGLFRDIEIDNRKVFGRIYKREEIYKGPYLDEAPDLVSMGNKGFNLKASMNSKNLYSKDIFTGKHTHDNAFLLIDRESDVDIIPDNLNVCDVLNVIDKLQRRELNEQTT